MAVVLVGLAVLAASCTGAATTSASDAPGRTFGAARGSSAMSSPAQSVPSWDSGRSTNSDPPARLYLVLSVADGDTITVDFDGARERIRLIGIDAPEVSGNGECFGNEASFYARGILTGTSVGLVPDPTQDDRDRYGRLLRYVLLADGTDFDAQLIAQGYAREYTYDKPYQRQAAYRAGELAAHSADRGLWSPATCAAASTSGFETATSTSPAGAAQTVTGAQTASGTAAPDCDIKGNINSKGEKIYHQTGESSYAGTVITESKGERYFCSVAEAVAAGWRAAKN